MTVRVVSLAVPAVVVMDILSDAVDFPWWAYLFLVIGSFIYFYRVYR